MRDLSELLMSNITRQFNLLIYHGHSHNNHSSVSSVGLSHDNHSSVTKNGSFGVVAGVRHGGNG